MDKFLKIFSNMDSSSELLLFLIVLVFLMLVSILIINKITKNKTNKVSYTSNRIKQIEKITKEEIKSEEPIIEKENEIKKEENKEIIKVNEKTSIDKIEELLEEGTKINPIDLTKFEEEQEANAIISYDELVKKAGATKIIYECDSSNDDMLSHNETKEEKEDKKFIASKVISPIYGVQKNETDDFIDLEEFDDNKYELNDEKDEKFLKSLKEFRSELN